MSLINVITVSVEVASLIASNSKLTNALGYDGTYSYYTSLANAISDAASTETVITLINDTTEHDLTISSDKNIKLDLNGHTIDANYLGRLFNNAGTLTIDDSTATTLEDGTYVAGKLINGTLYSVTPDNTPSADKSVGNGIYNSGTLTINNGIISGCIQKDGKGAGNGGGIFTTGKSGKGTVYLNGGS